MDGGTSPYAYTHKVLRLDGRPLRPKTLARMGRRRRELAREVGRQLREMRTLHGLTQQELAGRTAEVALALQQERVTRNLSWAAGGLTQRTISYLETGQRAPSVRAARLLIEALALPAGHPLRRDLIKYASRARSFKRRARAATRTNRLAGAADRLVGATARALLNRMEDLKAWARADREAGRRTRKGGWPQRHPLISRRRRRAR